MTRIRETKEIGVYGSFKRIEQPHRERRLVTRRDGIRQHFWYGHKKARLSEKPEKGRYEFHSNNNRALYKAMVKAHEYMPKGYVRVDAEDFNEHPEKYGVRGEWINRKVTYRGGMFT